MGDTVKGYDLDAIKARLPQYLESIGVVKEQRGKLFTCCPLHEDRHPSLTAEEKGGCWVWKCWPCRKGGTVIDLHVERTGTTLADAISDLARMFNSPAAVVGTTTKKPTPKAMQTPYDPTDAELSSARAAAKTLGLDAHLCARIAKARSWKPETIQRLASECSLGWEDNKLGFIYSTGLKLRWRQAGERRFMFAFGKPHSLWREHMREKRTERFIITEGETDAIRLIDLGLDDAINRVVALPSASTWPLDAEVRLRGLREVIFAPDDDKAGQSHVAEWSALVRRYVPTVRILNWKTITTNQ
ncbi:MAG: CHC2 zinc finger domain-containing protein [Chthoniobacteraceae bacterium]